MSKRALVTGAAGFIGGRVAHRIAVEEGWNVIPLVHSISGAGTMRLGRLPVDIEQGSILDEDHIEQLLADCDAVINCAHGGQEVTVDGTETLLSAAEKQGIDTYVHMSSAVVHGHDASGTITEETPLAPDTDYATRKAAAEKIIRNWDGALEPTVFRPCIVYGPHSPWVRKPLGHLQHGAVLADGGIGELNRIYVDNLVDAILLALDESDAAGEVFLAADDNPVTWSEYYQRLGRCLEEHPPIQSLSTEELALYGKLRYLRDSVVPPVRLCRRLLTSPEVIQQTAAELKETPWAPAIYRRLPDTLQDDILTRLNTPADPDSSGGTDSPKRRYRYPPENQMKLQSTRTRLSTANLKSTLGWEPRVTFEQGMQLVSEWATYEELTGDCNGYTPQVGSKASRRSHADVNGAGQATEGTAVND